MTNEFKELISAEVAQLANRSSQKRVANKAKVSAATINHIINRNWSLIADEMWRKVQVNLKLTKGWNTAVISNFKTLTDLLKAAQRESMSIGIAHAAGAGKTETFEAYERNFANVIHVECKNTWSTKSYVKALLQAAGLEADGTVEEMIETFTEHLITLKNPMVIIDQCDKLKEKGFDLFMDLYNDLDGHCGFMVSGVPALAKRVEKGIKNRKTGYAEFWSRIGCKWIKLDFLSLDDVKAVCEANGLTDQIEIARIYNEALGDLRVVKRMVQKYFLVLEEKARKAA